MKTSVFIVLVLFAAASCRILQSEKKRTNLLGSKECTWGPSYWCQNLTAAADCHATKHCIQTVWIHKQPVEDRSSVCQTCLDMVKLARDQLLSNETQDELRQVLEGSCALMHVKVIVKECDKLVDDYIPDLIDTLASEMNPQVVCSVAGLCNNDRFKALLAEPIEDFAKKPADVVSSCEGCHTVVGVLEGKFRNSSRDQVRERLLRICGEASSLSDACSNIVIKYFSEIYAHLEKNLKSSEICMMTGECSAKFHTHLAKVEITPMSHVGYIPVGKSEDIVCEFCEQLVGHLRDLLVANTTEDEFEKVMEGLCNQTKSFKDECLGLVREYYAPVYDMLVKGLNGTYICGLAGICPQSNKLLESAPLIPLLPTDTEEKALEITPASPKFNQVNMAMKKSPIEILETPEQAQLPIEKIMPPHVPVLYDTQLCVFCEYFLHFVQQAITTTSTEDEIKEIVDKACERLPSSINETCIQFVDTYGSAFVAILAQEIDPSTVCPLLRLCPASNVKDVEIFMQERGDNSKCPLCLFAVSKLEDMVKDKKTEEDIKEALGKLCSHLSGNLVEECQDFVNTYADELVDLLIADLNPQEVCVYLKLCTDKRPAPETTLDIQVHYGADTETNEIQDNTYDGKFVELETSANPQCVLCEFIMKEIDDRLKDKNDEEEIKKVVHDVCNYLPGTIRTDCNKYVNKYADIIIQLLASSLEPSEVCKVMNMCSSNSIALKVEIFDCAICEVIGEVIYKITSNPNIDHTLNHVLEKACRALPLHEQSKCKSFIEKYGVEIYELITRLENPGLVCRQLGLCSANEVNERMTRGLFGSNRCTWGPGYWCKSLDNANECGTGALKHCQIKVWGAEQP